jgi:hypothetical protein
MSVLIENYDAVVKQEGLNTNRPVDFSGASTVALPANTTIGGSVVTALVGTITSAGANALAVGPTGATNPIFNVNAATASAVTGVTVVGAAAAGGVAVGTTSTGTNENLTVDAKGSGTVGINTVSTTSGVVTIGNSASLAGASVNGAVIATKQLRSSTSTALGATGTVSLDPTLGQVFTCTPTGNITLNAASAAVGSRVYLVVTTSGTNTYNITPTTNFISTGALATGATTAKTFVVVFVGTGTNLVEISRTAAM